MHNGRTAQSGSSSAEAQGSTILRRDPTRLSPDQVRAILDVLHDPRRLRRTLDQLAGTLPAMVVPDPHQLLEDLRTAIRVAQERDNATGPIAVRRYRILELLVSDRLTNTEAAAALYLSPRTFYRARQEAVEEITPALQEILEHRAGGNPATTLRLQTTSLRDQRTDGVPQPKVFVGRARELASAQELLHASRTLLIGGPAGIGKTSFTAVLAQQLSIERPVLWHHIRPGLTDSVSGVLFAIAQRTAQLGSGALEAFLRRPASSDRWQLLAKELAVHAVEEHRLGMTFDGAECIVASAAVCGLLATLHAECPNTMIVLVARSRMPLLTEATMLELNGLDIDSAAAFMEKHGVSDLSPAALKTLVRQTGGNPQLLHLAAGALLHGELPQTSLTDRLLEVPDVQAFFFEHICEHIPAGKHVVLQGAALLRCPETTTFLATALEGLTSSIPATLAELGRRFLFTHDADGLRLHPSVRELVRRTMPHGERIRLHRRLARAYARYGRIDEACHHWLEADEAAEARRALLSASADLPPHVEARLRPLVERLLLAGFEDDPDLLGLATRLG